MKKKASESLRNKLKNMSSQERAEANFDLTQTNMVSLDELERRLEILQTRRNIQHELEMHQRGRSVSVGTAFGGTCELSIRRNNGEAVFVLLQPSEMIELINQMAASVGCHIAIKPREDFASWRAWKDTYENSGNRRISTNWVPWPEISNQYYAVGREQEPQNQTQQIAEEKKIQTDTALTKEGNSNEQTVATQKTVNKRSAKRTTGLT